ARAEHAMRARDDLGLAAAAPDRAELPAGRVDQHAGAGLARRRAAVAHDVRDRHGRRACEASAQLAMEREGVVHGRTLPHPQIASRAAAAVYRRDEEVSWNNSRTLHRRPWRTRCGCWLPTVPVRSAVGPTS